MDQTIQGGHNLTPNPSFEGAASGTILKSGTVAVSTSISTDWAFSGPNSFRAIVTTAGTGTLSIGQNATAGQASPVSLGELYGAGITAYSPVPGLQVQLSFKFLTAAYAEINNPLGPVIPLPSKGVIRLHMENLEPPPDAAFAVVRVTFSKIDGSSWSVGDAVYVDGIQLNTGGTPDHYIDGDQGASYSWDGTPHASSSRRADFKLQGPTGTGGVIDVSARVFRSDVQGNIGADISGYILAGTWDWDIDRDGPKTLVRLTIDGANVIQPMEWVAIFLDVFYENGTTESGQLGIYRMELPDRRYAGESVEVEAAGFDPIILLDDRTLETNVTLAAGTNIVSTIRTYLNQVGVRHSIPNRSNVISSAGASWKVHTKWSTFLNELAAMAGLYALHTNDKGQVTSKPVIASLADEQASHKYTIGRNSKLIGDILFKPNGSSIFNRVVVARDDPAQGAILTAVRSFSDPASAYSTVNMGVKTRAYSMQNAATQAVINAYADARIQELSLFMYGELKIIPTPFHAPYEVIDLDFEGNTENPVLAEHSGKYYVKGVSFDLMSTEGTMGLSIRRTERFDDV